MMVSPEAIRPWVIWLKERLKSQIWIGFLGVGRAVESKAAMVGGRRSLVPCLCRLYLDTDSFFHWYPVSCMSWKQVFPAHPPYHGLSERYPKEGANGRNPLDLTCSPGIWCNSLMITRRKQRSVPLLCPFRHCFPHLEKWPSALPGRDLPFAFFSHAIVFSFDAFSLFCFFSFFFLSQVQMASCHLDIKYSYAWSGDKGWQVFPQYCQ